MLKIERDITGRKFVCTSKPKNLKITVATPEEVAKVVRHYFGFASGKHIAATCPVCKQIRDEQEGRA